MRRIRSDVLQFSCLAQTESFESSCEPVLVTNDAVGGADSETIAGLSRAGQD